MDPQATYDAWLESDSAVERRELREAYNSWRDKQGYGAAYGRAGATDDEGGLVLRIPNDDVEGQDSARGILAVNPEPEGSPSWHAWSLGYDNAQATDGCYDEPLSGEWADQVTPHALHALVARTLDCDVDDLYAFTEPEEMDSAFELGYRTWVGGWRV